MTDSRHALIVAHGQPSDPAPAEKAFQALVRSVADRLPRWQVAGATLAAPGAMEAALAGLGPRPIVYPHFISQGWFTRTHLPARLASAGAGGAPVLLPFGEGPPAHSLAASCLAHAAVARGWTVAETPVVLAAHGSRSGAPEPSAVLSRFRAVVAAAGFRDIRAGFLEEPPFLAEAARDCGPRALCLPVFIARWGHVEEDLPRALAEAGFAGETLAPMGSLPEAAAIIAGALTAAPVPIG